MVNSWEYPGTIMGYMQQYLDILQAIVGIYHSQVAQPPGKPPPEAQ